MEWLTWAVIAVFVGWIFFQTVRVVPQRKCSWWSGWVNYKSLEAGFHILIPFIDKVSYKHTLKEQTRCSSQSCITADNIAVEMRHFVPAGSGCTGCELWYPGLQIRDFSACANHAAFRDRSNRTRPHV